MHDTWLKAIRKSEIVGAVFLDFSKAFDLVNHNVLLKKLELYIPKSPALQLITSYLSERKQCVYANGKHSTKTSITTGVPQGSILGPLLFILYVNDLPLFMTKETITDLFADEYTLLKSGKNIGTPRESIKETITELFADDGTLHISDKNIDTLKDSLQLGLYQAEKWSMSNGMIIHPKKTQSMVITTRQKHQICPLLLNLTLGKMDIDQTLTHKLLGVQIDSNLDWHQHISSLLKLLSQNVYLLSQLNKYATTEALKVFFDAHINSHINYASTIWDGCCDDLFKQVNALHRRAVKLILPHHTIPTDDKYKHLNILPLKSQLEFNKINLIHKTLKGNSPSYLLSLLDRGTDRYGSNNLILPPSRIDLDQTSLAYSGSSLYNKIPSYLKNITSTAMFRSHLRHLLLRNAVG